MYRLIDVRMKLELCSTTIIIPSLLLLFLVHVVIFLFLSFLWPASHYFLSDRTYRVLFYIVKKKRRITLRLSQPTEFIAVKCNRKQVVTCTFLESSSSFSLIQIDKNNLFFDIDIYLIVIRNSLYVRHQI